MSKTSQKHANLKLVGLVGVFILVALHIAGLIGQVLSTSDSFTFTTLVKTLFMRACVFTDVCESVHCGSRFARLKNSYIDSVKIKQHKAI